MAEHAGKPEVRFAGFTEAWEQRKLGEIADIVGGGTPSTNNPSYWNGDIDWYAPAEIGEQIFLTGSQKKITVLGLQKSSATILPVGSVLFTSRAGIGNTAILAKQGATNQGFQSIVPDSQITDSYFIFSRTHELKKYAEIVGAGSTFTEVSGKQMARMPILMPKIDEQVCIGTFFRNLDRLITLHQRKRGRLENIKKAMLEKMFPKNGADVPEVRFAGFTEAWEQRKLGEIAEKTFGGGTPSTSNPDFWSGKIPWIQSSDLTEDNLFDVKPRKFISKLAIKSSASKIIPKNSIAIIVRVGVGKLAFLPFNYSTSQDFLSITEINVDELFALYSIYKKLKKDLSLVQGTSIKGITKEELLRKTLFIPIKKSEQARIGAFFRHLDRLITLHQRKVALLQNIKKACLEKMFV